MGRVRGHDPAIYSERRPRGFDAPSSSLSATVISAPSCTLFRTRAPCLKCVVSRSASAFILEFSFGNVTLLSLIHTPGGQYYSARCCVRVRALNPKPPPKYLDVQFLRRASGPNLTLALIKCQTLRVCNVEVSEAVFRFRGIRTIRPRVCTARGGLYW